LEKKDKRRKGAGYSTIVKEKEGWLIEKRRPFYITFFPNSNYKFGTGSIPGISRNFQKRDLQTNQKIGLTFQAFGPIG
jgi:hypothetical protein